MWNCISHNEPWAKAKGVIEQDAEKYILTMKKEITGHWIKMHDEKFQE